MARKALGSIALVTLVACQPATELDSSEPTRSGPASEASPAVSSPAPLPAVSGDRIVSPDRLIGEYRVAGVDGEGIDLPYGITASITAETIHLTADCVNVEWGYAMDGDGTLSTLRVPTEGCARGLNPTEEALVAGFDGAERVSRNASNGYEFSGRGPTVTLFTQ